MGGVVGKHAGPELLGPLALVASPAEAAMAIASRVMCVAGGWPRS